MQILINFITFVLFVLSSPITSASPPAKSSSVKPYTYTSKKNSYGCSPSPKRTDSLPYEFWIELEFVNSFDTPFKFRRNNPLRVDRNYNLFAGAFSDRVTVTETYQIRDLFLLKDGHLLDSGNRPAELLPDINSRNDYFGYTSLIFDFSGDIDDGFPDPLTFTAVEVCTGHRYPELQLRAKRTLGNDKGGFFSIVMRFRYNAESKKGGSHFSSIITSDNYDFANSLLSNSLADLEFFVGPAFVAFEVFVKINASGMYYLIMFLIGILHVIKKLTSFLRLVTDPNLVPATLRVRPFKA